MQCVFDNPVRNGGCIFADPSVFIVLAELDTRAPGGPGKRRSSMKYTPGISNNRHLAMLEDEELLIMLQAYFASKIKH